MITILTMLFLAAPFTYNQNGIAFNLELPSDWVIDSGAEDCLAAFSQRDGLGYLSVNLFSDLLWSNALDVFSESTQEFSDLGYKLVNKVRLSKGELKKAAADDGARFHYLRQDGKIKEHIFILAVVRENVALLLTFYLPRWREDQPRLNEVMSVMSSFHFGEQSAAANETNLPVPPLR